VFVNERAHHRQRSTCQLQRRDRLPAADSGMLLQKAIKGIARFQIREQDINRHAGACEYRRAAKDVRVAVDH